MNHRRSEFANAMLHVRRRPLEILSTVLLPSSGKDEQDYSAWPIVGDWKAASNWQLITCRMSVPGKDAPYRLTTPCDLLYKQTALHHLTGLV